MTDTPPRLDLIEIAVEPNFARVTLNRPDKRNAMNLQLQMELREALDWLRERTGVIVLGANGPAFCAGVDLKEGAERSRTTPHLPRLGQVWFETLEHIRRHPAIFIAAVDGFALGGGLTLVNTCELAIASDRASFGMPELGFGEFPGLAGATTLNTILPKHAAQMILTAQRLTAQQALASGLINAVVSPETLGADAGKLAEDIGARDRTLLRVTKRALWSLKGMPWSGAIERGMWLSTLSRGEAPE
jgi:enoyl-CoA hydratase/carnithine racemase